MKKILLLLLLSYSFLSAGAIDTAGRFNLFSSLYLRENQDNNIFLHRSGDFALQMIEMQFKLSSAVSEKVKWNLRFDVYCLSGNLFQRDLFADSGLLLKNGSESVGLRFQLYEGFLKIEDFLLPGLDLTAGKQRISWGTADKIGILDNLNPLDLAQFFTFSPEHFFERLPQAALNFEYYFRNDFQLQLVILPQKQLTTMPYGFATLIKSLRPEIVNIGIEQSWQPESLRKINFASRLSFKMSNVDLGVSYYHGNFSVPYLAGFSATSATALFIYPRLDVFGIDLAGEISGAGWWAEAGLFLPEKREARLDYLVVDSQSGRLIEAELEGDLFSKSYFKFVLGADYHFGNGFYLNCQYLHGFFDEAGFSDFARNIFGLEKGNFFAEISDYLFLRTEKKLFSDKLLLKLSAIGELRGDGIWTLFPEVEWSVYENLKLQSGILLPLEEKNSSRFGFFYKNSMLYLMLKADF